MQGEERASPYKLCGRRYALIQEEPEGGEKGVDHEVPIRERTVEMQEQLAGWQRTPG